MAIKKNARKLYVSKYAKAAVIYNSLDNVGSAQQNQ